MLLVSMKADLGLHLERVHIQHAWFLSGGVSRVESSGAGSPNFSSAGSTMAWQCVFPATRIVLDQENRERLRNHYLHGAVVQAAASSTGQNLFGHKEAATTPIYLNVMNVAQRACARRRVVSWRTTFRKRAFIITAESSPS